MVLIHVLELQTFIRFQYISGSARQKGLSNMHGQSEKRQADVPLHAPVHERDTGIITATAFVTTHPS